MPKHNLTAEQISFDYYQKNVVAQLRFEKSSTIACGQVRDPDGKFVSRREDEVRIGIEDDEESPIQMTNDGDEFVPLEELCSDCEDEECEDEEPEELPAWYFQSFHRGTILGTNPIRPTRPNKPVRPSRINLVQYRGQRRGYKRRPFELLAA